MKSLAIFFLGLLGANLSSAQKNSEFYLLKADSLNSALAYSLSRDFYDSARISAASESNGPIYVRALIGLGWAYRYDFEEDNRNYELSREFFLQAFELLQKMPVRDQRQMAQLFYDLGTTERVLFDYDKAKEYVELSRLASLNLGDPEFTAKILNETANIHHDLREFETSFDYYTQAILLRESLNAKNDWRLATYYQNMGITMRSAGNADQSLEYFLKALEITRQGDIPNPFKEAILFGELGQSYRDLRQKDLAQSNYKKSISMFSESSGASKLKSNSLWKIAKLHTEIQQFDSALFFLQKAIVAQAPEFEPTHLLAKPDLAVLDNSLLNADMVFYLDDMATAIFSLYKDNDDINYLQTAREIYHVADTIMTRLRFQLSEDDPSIHLAKHFKIIYEHALFNLFELYSVTGNSELLNEAYNYVERNKQTILLKSKLTSTQFGLKSEYEIQIREVQEKTDELRLKIDQAKGPNPESFMFVDAMINELAMLHAQKHRLMKESTFNVDSLDYQLMELGLVQEFIGNERIMLNYFWGDDAIYALGITADNVIFNRIQKGSLDADIADLVYCLSHFNQDTFSKYTHSSKSIYESLFAPFIESDLKSTANEILIVPDSKLNMIPAAALLRSDPEGKTNYQDLDYLIKHFQITYALSGSLLIMDPESTSGENSLLGFSSELLEGTQEELDYISGIWKSGKEILQGDLATEHNFKLKAPSFDIIHLATHGSPGDENSQANLLFVKDSDGLEDGKLYAYEIYPLQLQSKMTILSACETGVGELYEGEGVFSLARGFSYAGSPTVVMSLWEVPDKSTTRLISLFYQGITKGLSVTEGMREAQLRYISESEGFLAHPSYWSSFVVMGNGSQKFTSSWITSYYTIIGVTLLGIILLASRYRKRIMNRNQTAKGTT